ncbi:MAG: CHRD domain-containing protein [Bryobacterales bacterium]
MRTLCVLVCLMLFVPLGASADVFSTHYFQASLSPSAETPAPISVSMASGSSLVRIHIRRSDTGEFMQAAVDFDTTLSVVQEQNLVNMHIHRGAAGVGGPVVIDSVFGSPIPVEAGGTARIIRQFIVASDNTAGIATIEALLENPEGYYVNVHSSAHPPGVARGQLHPVDLAATLGVGDQVADLQATVDALQTQLTAVQNLLNRVALRFSINP